MRQGLLARSTRGRLAFHGKASKRRLWTAGLVELAELEVEVEVVDVLPAVDAAPSLMTHAKLDGASVRTADKGCQGMPTAVGIPALGPRSGQGPVQQRALGVRRLGCVNQVCRFHKGVQGPIFPGGG